MQTCARCQASFDAPPGVPCPRCGSVVESSKSPMARTTERPAMREDPESFGAGATMPSQGLAPPAPSASYPQHPQPPYGSPQLPMQSQPYPSGPQYAAPPHGHYPMQPIQIVVQNQINVPPPYPMQLQPYVMPAYPMAVPYAKRKDPGVAVLCSFFLPGAGQLYNGQVGKGLAFMLATFVNFVLMFVGIGFLTGLATWIWSMVDAHGTADKINRGQIVA